jgi:hypothetical protein
VARREDRRRFWEAIAAGLSSEDAGVGTGVSPVVGTRWFREAGGMPPSTLARSSKPPSGRYLSFADREEIALWRAQGHGVREVARRLGRAASTISRELVLLCHFRLALRVCFRRQQGHLDSVLTRPTVRRRRMVAMEFGTCRSGRTGTARPEAFG